MEGVFLKGIRRQSALPIELRLRRLNSLFEILPQTQSVLRLRVEREQRAYENPGSVLNRLLEIYRRALSPGGS